jgi:NAD(P)-dependent dehydrogenase (short-subunit alcohol dehydrogenase family)
MAENNLKRAALITGGAIRMGREIALFLASVGYDIALHYHASAEAAELTQKKVVALGVKCEVFQADLTLGRKIPELVRRVVQTFPNLSVLVNSASGYRQARLLETTPEIFESQMRLNVQAPFFLTKSFAERCGKGSVINIIDNKIAYNQFHYAAYLLSKKSLAEFTKMAAMELAPHIRVNGVSPGVVLPAESRSQEYIDWRVAGIPLKKQGSPANITHAIRYLLDNPFVTGQILFVDGGEATAHLGLNAGMYDQDKV